MNDDLKKDFAPGGVLRAGINLGNPVIAQPGAGGEPGGVGPALARELARRLGLPIRFTTYETAGKLAAAVKEGAWDVGFLAIDPERAQEIDFTDAYVDIEGTYMVRDDSPLRRIGDVDRAGIRIAVGLKTAYDLYLTREIRNATLVRSASSRAAIAQFLAERLDVVAGVKQPLLAAAAANPGLRVMDGNFMVIRQAAAVPRGRKAAKEYLAAFIEEAKSSGFVARALRDSGVEASVAAAAR
ncbi:MAG TPA: transporter substrate-binding domain-containing protein [Usitatibacter sp.]|nr:transporter substrate-binding domain-containing protein [Usitatibacter sp.]